MGASSGDLDDSGIRVAAPISSEFDLTHLVLDIVHPSWVRASKDVLLAAEVVPIVVRVMAWFAT